MPDSLNLLNNGIAMISQQFGGTVFTIEGMGAVSDGNWNELGRTEVMELNGRRISFSALVEFRRALFPLATDSDFLNLPGRLVTRGDNGLVFRIVGQVQLDALTVRVALDSKNK